MTTGLWYDDSYDRTLSPPLDGSSLQNLANGNLQCTVVGTEVTLLLAVAARVTSYLA